MKQNPNLPSIEQIEERIKQHLPGMRWLLSSTQDIGMSNPQNLPYFANVFDHRNNDNKCLDETMNGALFQAYAKALDKHYEAQYGQTNR